MRSILRRGRRGGLLLSKKKSSFSCKNHVVLKSSRSCQFSTIKVFQSNEEVVERMKEVYPSKLKHEVYAMYSSVIGGIVTKPEMMSVPIDDHMVHRGHAVFDTCNVKDGKVYGLDFHIDRILNSATKARIDTSKLSKEKMKQIILSTISASEKTHDIFVRYWLSAGRGDFGVSPTGCDGGSQFYVMVHKDVHNHNEIETRTSRRAVSIPTSSIPEKPPLLATTKSNNYMINAIVALEAEKLGGDFGLQIDSVSDTILESSVSCVAIVNRHGALVTPKFDRVLPSTTLKRLIDEYVPNLVQTGVLTDFAQRDVHIREVLEAKEMIEFGGGWVHPVVSLDKLPIGDGEPGPVFDKICDLMVGELENERYVDVL